MLQNDKAKKFGDWIGFFDYYDIGLLFNHRFFPCTNTKKETAKTFIYESFNNSAKSNFKEYSILKSSNHPNLLKVQDVLKTSHNIYVVYENFADNYQTLEKYRSEKKISDEEIFEILDQILSGLLELNKLSLVLRALSPNSIILYENKWKIADYKTIKYIEDINDMRQKYSNSIVFPNKREEMYLAPEIKNKEYGITCDVYSLGKIFLALLIGPSKFETICSQNINLQDLGLKEDKIKLIQELLDENFFKRPTPKKLANILQNFTAKKNSDKNIFHSQITNEKVPLSNKTGKNSEILYKDKKQIVSEKNKITELDFQKDDPNPKNLKGFHLLADYIYKKIEEISKIASEITLNNKNKKIYELVYILSHLELAVHFHIHDEYQEIKKKNEKLTELLKEKTDNFHSTIRILLKKGKREYLDAAELNQISLFIKEFIEEALIIKNNRKIHIFLRFLEGFAWLVSKKTLAKKIFEDKHCELKADFIKKLKNRLKKEEEEEINKDSILDRINKLIKE